MASRKLEAARFIIYDTCFCKMVRKQVKELERLIKEECPLAGKDFWKKVRDAESKMFEKLALVYSKEFTLKELNNMYEYLKSPIGVSIMSKGLKLAQISAKIGGKLIVSLKKNS